MSTSSSVCIQSSSVSSLSSFFMRSRRRPILLLIVSLGLIGLSASSKSSWSSRSAPSNMPISLQNSTNSEPEQENENKPVKPRGKKHVASTSKTRPVSSKSDTLRRIEREWKDIVASGMGYNWREAKPIKFQQKQHIWIGPIHSSLLVWHFTLVGLPDSPYDGGLYHGRLILPDNYPAAPPRIQVWTPSGRFLTREDICLTASSFHPELWSSSWTIRTLIEALRLHFVTHPGEVGGINEPYESKLGHAKASLEFFCQIPINRQNVVAIDHAKMIRQGLFAEIHAVEREYVAIGQEVAETKKDLQYSSARHEKLAAAERVLDSDQDGKGLLTLSKGENVQTNVKARKGTKQQRVAFVKSQQLPVHSAGPKPLRVQPAPEPSLVMATFRKLLQRPLLWCLLLLFYYLNVRS